MRQITENMLNVLQVKLHSKVPNIMYTAQKGLLDSWITKTKLNTTNQEQMSSLTSETSYEIFIFIYHIGRNNTAVQ